MSELIASRMVHHRTKWIILGVGLLLAAISMPFFSQLEDAQDNEAAAWLPGDAESTKAFDELAAFGDPEALTTSVVYSQAGGLSEADLATIEEQRGEVGAIEDVVGEPTPTRVSDDGEVATYDVVWSRGGDTFLEMPDFRDEIHAITDGGSLGDATVEVAGFGGIVADQATAFAGGDSWLLLTTLAIVIVILLITYRSPTMWLLPIICSVVALIVSGAVIYFLATQAGLTVNGQAQFILTVLVVGAGTDYALLLVARYREELHNFEDHHEAMAVALHRASPAILASAGTVAVGMLCLMLAEMNSTAGLGPVLAIGVVVTVVTMLTLLPALLVIFGRRIFWPRKPEYRESEVQHSGFWARVGERIASKPRRVWIGTALGLGACCLGLFSLDPRGLSIEESFTDSNVESLRGQDTLAEAGLFDQSNPVLIVAKAERAPAVAEAVDGVEGVGGVAPPLIQDDTALISAAISTDAYSQASFDTVEAIRDAAHAVPGADALVGGNSAIGLDTKVASSRDNKVVVPVVLVMVLLILILLLRSLASPLLLIGTVVLSFGAALGISSLIFTQVLDIPATDAGFPLFAFVFLVALGIDYNIFLMSRVREETVLRGTREGSLVALSSTGGVITSAGLVLAATFVALGTLPLVFAQQIGIAVALGVLLDTLIVRSVLVTALNLDLGSRIWWPSRLDRGPHAVESAASERLGETVR